jgi:hypothetical protein
MHGTNRKTDTTLSESPLQKYGPIIPKEEAVHQSILSYGKEDDEVHEGYSEPIVEKVLYTICQMEMSLI